MSDPEPARLARRRLSGTRRGRFIAAALTLSAAVALSVIWVGIAASPGYVVLNPVKDGLFIMPAAIGVAVSIAVAGWLVTSRRPVSIVIRILTCLLAVMVLGAGALGGLLYSSFASEVLATEVVAVSPGGRFEVIRQNKRDYKGGVSDEVRVRSRAGLLSRDADQELAAITCADGVPAVGRIRAEFVAARQVSFAQVRGPAVTVAFDDSLRPAAFVSFCP